ncbi:MAG: dihydrofolate reductase family protein [bacterium]|nr:dihydrofolate reductase family protein [bacterium]
MTQDTSISVRGPALRFETLFDDETASDGEGLELHPDFAAVYGGPLRFRPPVRGMPLLAANFVTSHDGRVAFNHPDHRGGGPISGFNDNDVWLMGLLRARTDAVVIGEGTLRAEPSHVNTSEDIYPGDKDAFAALRRHENRSELPIISYITLEGNLPPEARVFSMEDAHVVVATTRAGARKIRATVRPAGKVDILEFGSSGVNLERYARIMAGDYGVEFLLCEGGATLYGAFLKAGIMHEPFITRSPLVVGENPGNPRPSLVEGTGWLPDDIPRMKIASVRKAGDYLYMRYRATYPD